MELEQAQKALEVALDEACGVDVSKVDTGELIRIEETLAAARDAAKQAVSFRLKRRRERGSSPADAPEAMAVTADMSVPPDEITQRVFDDLRGKRWRAFAVNPTALSSESGAIPEAFRRGWLSFESADEMRRVAPAPANWQHLTIEELRVLCAKAPAAPKRLNNLGQRNEPDG